MNVRPAVRNLAILFAVILTPIAAHQLWDYIELRRLIAEINAIRAKGEPVTELEAGVGRAPQPGEPQRAGRMYTAAALLASNTSYASLSVVSGIHEWLSGAIADPPAGAAERLQSLISESSQALALADQAGSLSFQGFPPGTEYNYRTAELHLLARLIGARTIGFSALNQGDAAVESAMSDLRMRNALRDLRSPSVFGDGIEVPAILGLSHPGSENLRRLQESLQANELDRMVEAVLVWRARQIEMVWRRYYGSFPQAPDRYLLPSRSVNETVMRPWITRQTVGTLRVWSELVEAARTPWPGRIDAAATMASKYGGARFDDRRRAAYETFAMVMRPDDLIKHRASIAAIAVERYRRDHGGALPGMLQDLVPQYLDAVPQDPATGQALLFKKDAGAFTIYSVGVDKKDDGGDLNSELLKTIKQGHGRRVIRGTDIGVRVLDR